MDPLTDRRKPTSKTLDRRGFLWAAAVGAAAAMWAAGCTQGLAPRADVNVKQTSGLLAEGTEWETPYYILESGIPGPTLLVTGGVHGDEPAGYRAAEEIRHWPLKRGRLIVVPRVNTPGLKAGTRWLPGEAEATRNANRNFPKTGAPNTAVSLIVRALWEFIQAQSPDWVADLHEGSDFHVVNPTSVGSSIVFFDTPEMHALAKKIQQDVNATITDPQREIVLRTVGPIDGGLVRATIERTGAKGFCFETTYKQQPLSLRTRQHRLMVHRLMRELDMAAGDAQVMTPRPKGGQVQVAVYDGGGTGGKGATNLTGILDGDERTAVHHVGPPDIAAGALEQFDVVIFPGGSGKAEAGALGKEAVAAVRTFVRNGGGYVGICAGAFLSSTNYEWSLAIINNQTIPGKLHERGGGTVTIELTDGGRQMFGDKPGLLDVYYHNGPMFLPAGLAGLPAFTPLALFRSEVSKYEEQKGTMIHTPAIIAAPCGRGRVLAISPHPESVPALHFIIRQGVQWVAGREQAAASKPAGAAVE
ncbi:MAG: succinylglutamate desuccinylase/aspartoacylase family protein [Planctomycetes bacterium]|nr:succinylglutamate desuccinylase/aspartoacylase family protein [Planctomycetota bacterium]